MAHIISIRVKFGSMFMNRDAYNMGEFDQIKLAAVKSGLSFRWWSIIYLLLY